MRKFPEKEGQMNLCPCRQDTTELSYPHIVFCCVLLCCVPLFNCCSCSEHMLQCTITLRSRSLLSGKQKKKKKPWHYYLSFSDSFVLCKYYVSNHVQVLYANSAARVWNFTSELKQIHFLNFSYCRNIRLEYSEPL